MTEGNNQSNISSPLFKKIKGWGISAQQGILCEIMNILLICKSFQLSIQNIATKFSIFDKRIFAKDCGEKIENKYDNIHK